ncbi:MAG: BBE domain-containing protein, partial [Acetobacteraceae bacterium]|nr:BBE domain-containing protein [Acetobacteraceae bacterium]
RTNNVLTLLLVFQDLTEAQARAVFEPFLSFVAASPSEYSIEEPIRVVAVPARRWWDPDYLAAELPSQITRDPRPGAPPGDIWWAGNQGEVGFFLHGYESAWLPAHLLSEAERSRLDAALFAASRHWPVTLHYNKGLAGGPEEAIAAARDTAMNPAVADAFALAVVAHGGPPAYLGMPGAVPDLSLARDNAAAIGRAIAILRDLVPDAGSYVSEGGFADPHWQRRSFGGNYERLLAIKQRYDPEGLFTTHHGVGSEAWSQDGFAPS